MLKNRDIIKNILRLSAEQEQPADVTATLPFFEPTQPQVRGIDPTDAALKQTPGSAFGVAPGFMTIENPESEYFDQTLEEQLKSKLALKYLGSKTAADLGIVNEPPVEPFGKIQGAYSSLVGGLLGAQQEPVKGSSPALNIGGTLIGEGAKYVGLQAGLGLGGFTAGALSGTGRELADVAGGGEFDVGDIALESGLAGGGEALLKSVGAGLKSSSAVVTGQPTKTPTPKPKPESIEPSSIDFPLSEKSRGLDEVIEVLNYGMRRLNKRIDRARGKQVVDIVAENHADNYDVLADIASNAKSQSPLKTMESLDDFAKELRKEIKGIKKDDMILKESSGPEIRGMERDLKLTEAMINDLADLNRRSIKSIGSKPSGETSTTSTDTPEIASTLGYNPTIFKSLQDTWQKRVVDPMAQWVSGPTPSGVKNILRQKRTAQFFGRDEAEKLSVEIGKTAKSQDDLDALFRFLDPEAVGIKGEPLSGELAKLGARVRERVDQLGSRWVNEGLITPDKYRENFGKYMRRYYPRWEKFKEAARGETTGKSITKMVGDAFKRRTLRTPEERLAKNIIQDPRYVVSRTIGDMTFDLETAKALRRISDNPKWAQSAEAFSTTTDAAKHGFVHMPPDTRFGKLAGKWVQKDVADEIFAINSFTKAGKPSKLSGFYDTFLQNWKYGKTGLNPATHFRNIFSNFILADIGGGPGPHRVDIYSKALLELNKKGSLYRQAVADNAISDDFIGTELFKVITPDKIRNSSSMFEMAADGLSWIYKKPGQIYQAEEQWFKLADYMYQRGKGMGSKEAANHAQRTLFDYSDISPALQRWRRNPFGGPFLSFTAKAIPAVAEAAVQRPWRFWKYPMMLKGMHEYSKVSLGINEEEYEGLSASLPPWKQNGFNVLVPWKSGDDNYAMIDLTWNMPYGQLGEKSSLFDRVPFLQDIPGTGVLDAFVGSNPVFTIPSDIVRGEARFSGRPLFRRGVEDQPELEGAHAKEVLTHIAKQISPGFIPAAIELGFGEKDKTLTVLNKVLGIRIDDVKQKEGLEIKRSQLSSQGGDVMKAFNSIKAKNNKGEISDEEFEAEKLKLKSLYDRIGVQARRLNVFIERLKEDSNPPVSKEQKELRKKRAARKQ